MRGRIRRVVPRKRLLQRVRMIDPRLLQLIAPAGWGKTTFANSLRAKSAQTTLLDCRGINDAAAFAAQMLDALAGDTPQGQALSVQQHLPFDERGFDLTSAAVRTWQTTAGPSLFVFDNAECLSANQALLDVLARLLARPHSTRRVVVASRCRIDVPTSGFAPPNEVLCFDACDLRFDTQEIRKLFGATLADEAALQRVEDATAGWPIAVLLIVAAARQGRLSAALADIDRGAPGILTDYFAHEVVEHLDGRERDALIAAATFPSSVPPLGLNSPGEQQFPLADTPFVTLTPSGAPRVHPLIRALMAQRYHERAKALAADIVSTVGDGGDHIVAAHASLWLGDQDAAASALSDCAPFLTGALSPRAAEVLADLDRAILIRYPAVWSAATLARVRTIEVGGWLTECRQVYAGMCSTTGMGLRLGVTSAYAYAAGVTGNFEEGRAALAALLAAAAGASAAERDNARAFATFWFAAYDVWVGDPVDIDRLQRAIEPLLADDALRALWMGEVVARRCRMYGDHAGERAALELACAAATRSGLPAIVSTAHGNALFGAWLAGEHAAFERNLETLDALPSGAGNAWLIDCARGRCTSEATPPQTPQLTCSALLIAASVSKDRARAEAYANSALVAADRGRWAYQQVIARVALAQIDEARYAPLLDEALRLAREHRNFALEASLESLRAHGPNATMLTPLSERFAHFRDASSPRVSLSIASVSVRNAEETIALSAREIAVLLRIALAAAPVTAHALGRELWPERPSVVPADACIDALRSKLGDDAVVGSPSGYALGPAVWVDLFEAERHLGGLHMQRVLETDARRVLENVRTLLKPQFPVYALGWAWFAPHAQRVRDAYRNTLAALTSDALMRNDFSAASDRADELLTHDPCDEFGCEAALTVARERSDSSSALAVFRRYESALRRELGINPPERLRTLLRATLRGTGAGLRVV